MAFSPEVKKVKAECWRSPFRAVARDERGRATHFVALSEREMMIAAVTGSVQIPDSQMPAAVLRQRDEQRELEGKLGAPIEVNPDLTVDAILTAANRG